MNVTVEINGIKKRSEAARIRRFSSAAFRKLISKSHFSFLNKKQILFSLVVSDRESARLNARYRKRHQSTNVLSFPLYPDLAALKRERATTLELGDIVISPRVVKKEAEKAGVDFYSQFCWMTLHGILHVLGLDHERGKAERELMERLEAEILSGR